MYLLKAFEIPVKRHYVTLSSVPVSTVLGSLASLSLMYVLYRTTMPQENSLQLVALKLYAVFILIMLILQGFFYPYTRKNKVK